MCTLLYLVLPHVPSPCTLCPTTPSLTLYPPPFCLPCPLSHLPPPSACTLPFCTALSILCTLCPGNSTLCVDGHTAAGPLSEQSQTSFASSQHLVRLEVNTAGSSCVGGARWRSHRPVVPRVRGVCTQELCSPRGWAKRIYRAPPLVLSTGSTAGEKCFPHSRVAGPLLAILCEVKRCYIPAPLARQTCMS
jgi:hypothetical protein